MHYGDELATVVKNMILISEVANLGKDIAKYGDRVFKKRKLDPRESHEVLSGFFGSSDNVANTDEKLPVVDENESSSEIDDDKVIDEDRKNKLTGTLSHSQKLRMEDLLGKWEEPDTVVELEVFDACLAFVLRPNALKDVLTYILFFATDGRFNRFNSTVSTDACLHGRRLSFFSCLRTC